MLFGSHVGVALFTAASHNTGQPAVVLSWIEIRTVDRVLVDPAGAIGWRSADPDLFSDAVCGDKSKGRAALEETQALPGDKSFYLFIFL